MASKDSGQPTPPRRRWLALLLTAVGLACLILLAIRLAPLPDPSAEETLAQALVALDQGDYLLAEELGSRIDPSSELWERSRMVAGEAASRAGRIESAIQFYRSISDGRSPTAIQAAFTLGELYRSVGMLSEAAEQYRHVLAHEPGESATHARLAFILGVSGQRWESLPHFMALVRTKSWDLDGLALLGDLERPVEQAEFLRHCARAAPDDILVRSGLAAHALIDGEVVRAREILQEVVADRPDLIAAQAMLGQLLLDTEEHVFTQWHADLPASAEGHPDIWLVRGLWARRNNDLTGAARCFWHTLRIAPEHRRGNYQLAQALSALEAEGTEEFAELASQLFELTQTLDLILRSRGESEAGLRRAAELMESMGRHWEAWAWAVTAANHHPEAEWPGEMITRLEGGLHEHLPRTTDAANLALKYDLSHYSLDTKLLADRGDQRRMKPGALASGATIRFEEEAAVGIDFVYNNGDDPATKGVRMFEQTGGGVAVLDYDSDGRPDIYFPQGGQWKTGSKRPAPSAEFHNGLYRNIDGKSFQEIASQAGIADLGFGQGATVGDFDNDGFPDIYVANIGENRLYRNNGDGTFSDVTASSGVSRQDWTCSAVMVDLNGDGLPDLFDVNYVTGPEVYELICDEIACSPKVFQGTPDQMWLNRGDGSFEHLADVSTAAHAKGLGVMATVLEEDQLPSLFVSNDQVPNFLLRPEVSDDSTGLQWVDQALLRGLAYNSDGVALACMGIAADDVNGDGRTDFFVTNFNDEPNTLYLQDAPGLFVDATRTGGLQAGSIAPVGWGTQFLDADLDGDVDLVIANGHIADYRDEGGEYHMKPQFFRNAGEGRFELASGESAGEYFDRKYLGRGLARLDWNGDGRMDFVVSNIGAPASLVTNQSQNVGNFLNVRLRGTTSSRDAIGSTVEITTDRRSWKKQLLAGDGVMASNQRMLQFGLGEANSISRLHVKWPSGKMTIVADLPANTTVELVEGDRRAILSDGSQRVASPDS